MKRNPWENPVDAEAEKETRQRILRIVYDGQVAARTECFSLHLIQISNNFNVLLIALNFLLIVLHGQLLQAVIGIQLDASITNSLCGFCPFSTCLCNDGCLLKKQN